jgi:hypothetical protein
MKFELDFSLKFRLSIIEPYLSLNDGFLNFLMLKRRKSVHHRGAKQTRKSIPHARVDCIAAYGLLHYKKCTTINKLPTLKLI